MVKCLAVSLIDTLLSKKHVDQSDTLAVDVLPSDFEDVEGILPVLVYIAGYCAFSTIKRLKCEECRSNLLLNKDLPDNESFSLINKINRGALAYPQEIVVTMIIFI